MGRATLFWDVDTQADFIDPGGRLHVPGAEKIVPNLRQLTASAAEHNVLVIASACAHHEGDAEFTQYPPHCLVGTPGQRKIAETRRPNALIVPNHKIELPRDLSSYEQVVLEKQQLNVFSNPNTEMLLKRIGRADVVLYGVVTELCVALAASELLRHGYQTRVVSDAICHLDRKKAEAFLDEVGNSGGEVTTTSEVLERLRMQRVA